MRGLRWLPREALAPAGVLLVFLLALQALSPRDADLGGRAPVSMTVAPLADAGGEVPRLRDDGKALMLDGAHRAGAVDIAFTLPERGPGSVNWVVWIPRVPLQSIWLQGHDGWQSEPLRFLAPSEADGLLPAGYFIRLPDRWEGPVQVRLHAVTLRPSAISPAVVTEMTAARYLQRATIVATIGYASLMTLALLGIALWIAARDRMFLAYFLFCVVTVLQLSAFNGHLALFDRFGWMAAAGGAGLHAVSLLFEAATLWVLPRYSGLHEARPALARRSDLAVAALVLVSALVLALRDSMPVVMDYLVPFLWLLGMVAAIAMVVDALVRRVPMAAAIGTAVAILVGTVIVAELTWRGVIVDSFATYYAYQMATVLSAAMLAVGLISRISRYREQRDREQRARADTERRMYREAVRSELLTALQVSLRGRDEGEVLPTAFMLLLEHLRRIVPSHAAVLVARGYHGADAVVAHPPVMQGRAESEMSARMATLRHQLAGSVETQRPVARDEVPGGIAMEALVALPIRAPSWGVIMIERHGSTPFHPDELAIARELARLAALQIDEAYSALHLRRTAEVDALTGLLNRRSLEQALVRSSHHAHRGGHALSVLYIDLDHFKPINDQHGHACGDHCLRAVSQMLDASVGEDGLVGRWGGEEFLAVLPGLGTEAARAVAETMRTAIESVDLVWQGQPLRLTVSIGVASQLPHEGQHGPAVERADAALYAAKRAGRNRVHAAPAVFQARPTNA